MMKLIRNSIIVFLLLSSFGSSSQELLCTVDMDTRQVEGAQQLSVFETLKTAIYEFMNNKIWTSYKHEDNERIECSILLTITAHDNNLFSGNLSVGLRRPVFNSNYNSVLINYIDSDISFDYIESQPLDFNQNTYTNNLVSLLAYYAYIFIGLEYDSFASEGGNHAFEAAQNVVNAAQNSNFVGWKAYDSQRNRYWLLENITNPSYAPLRKFYYEYHRLGLDVMYDNPDGGRQAILKTLNYLKEVKQVRAGLFLLQIIADAKRDEIVNVFSEGSSVEKNNALEVMKVVDPANVQDYKKITQ